MKGRRHHAFVVGSGETDRDRNSMMNKWIICALVLGQPLACRTPQEPTAATEAAETNNPLLAKWTGPFQGVPAFDQMKLGDLEAAIEFALADEKKELQAIASNPEAPTFANTIEAMEGTGRVLNRVLTYKGIWGGNLSTDNYREIQTKMAPTLANARTATIQNAALFARVRAVHESKELATLTPVQRRLVSRVYKRFALQGANLKGADRTRYAEIQALLAKLHTRFSDNVMADEEKYALFLTEDQLGGLPKSTIAAAAAAAADRGRDNGFAIINTRSSMDPFLTFSTERALRKKVWETYYNRGDNGDDNDNNVLITEILKLRHERANLLGYKNYAAWRLQDRMAGSPARALGLLQRVWPAARARVKQEVSDMQKLADLESADITIEPWDYRYYSEKVRLDKFALDSGEVKQYLQLDNLREAMFMVAKEVFGLRFTEIVDGSVPVFHADVRVWEVKKVAGGAHVGLWYLDPYARTGKRSGAWANTYRDHTTFDGKRNVLSSNNSNFLKTEGGPVLVSWDDARTFFHEFGHALHSLSSAAEYPSLSWGLRDYTEFQSQLLERWLFTDKVINTYLLHHETGKPMPAELVNKLKKASTFNSGFETAEYLASAIIDMKYHMTDPANLDADRFERESLSELGLPREIVMRHRSPHFGHIFSGEGYAAGYYGYLWAEVLTADAAEAFAEAPGGFYDASLGRKMVEHLFAPQNSVDPAEAYRAFRGRDATIDALMRDRGFTLPLLNLAN